MTDASNVVRVNFGPERDWEEAKNLALEGLLKVAEACGDDPQLMRAKAQRAIALLRQIAESDIELPPPFELPSDLRHDHLVAIRTAFVAFMGSAIVTTKLAVMELVTHALIDLCSSKLNRSRSC